MHCSFWMTATLAAAMIAGTGCGKGMDCAEGAYKSADPAFCIKLPADYQADKAMKSGENSYVGMRNSKTGRSFTVWLDKPEDLDKRAKAVAGMAGGDLKLVTSGDAGKGKFFHFHNTRGDYDFAVTLVPGKEHMYRCEIQNTPPEDAKAMVEACKTLSGP